MVAALCLNSVPYPSTGLLFELAVGWHARTRLQASHGSPIPRFDDLMTEIASKFLKDVADYDHFPPRYPEDAEYGLRELARQIPQFSTLQRIEDAKARKSHGTTYEYGDKEVMFYSKKLPHSPSCQYQYPDTFCRPFARCKMDRASTHPRERQALPGLAHLRCDTVLQFEDAIYL